jgi:hypothetical protein
VTSEYYWCLTHGTVEEGKQCRAVERLGPYATEEEARSWRDRHEGRHESWKQDDERWEEQDPDER